MEFLDGCTLREEIARKPVDLNTALTLGLRLPMRWMP
jgi:hypothetical protein